MKKLAAFTLVELLVVIAIITILAAMLLPTLDKALESTRRASCLNNTHQMFIVTQNYASSFNDYYPGPGKIIGSGNINALDYFATNQIPSTEGNFADALYILLFDLRYLDNLLVNCPSMDFKTNPDKSDYWSLTHYSYRYNIVSAASSYTKDKFYGNDGHRQPLFSDAASYRRSSSSPYDVYRASLSNRYYSKWAHLDGGNIVDQSGSGRFVRSYLNSTNLYYSWPSYGNVQIQTSDIIAYFNSH